MKDTTGKRVGRVSRWRGPRAILFFGIIIGGIAASIGSLVAAWQIEVTSTPEFCASCHEIEQFRAAWAEGPHGSMEKGVVSATCVDCHLPPPEDGILQYLTAKGMSGTKDIVSHLRGHEPDWVANLEKREEFTYEAGCTKCHVELVAPGIPLKAYLAHRDYMTGETSETCIACHIEVGHGNLKYMLTSKESANMAKAGQESAPTR
jgi:nitrate/TMAO reductase-like tetraheme cytochrome c subunit